MTAPESPETKPTGSQAKVKPTGGSPEDDPSKGWHDAVLAVTALLCPALIGLILFAIPDTREGIGMAVLTAAASFGVGSLFGFIFGIPRTLSSPHEDGAGLTADGGQKVAANTNLEQISDWLTKILVGVGLVQLGQIGNGIGSLAEGLAPSLGGGNTGYPVAIALMVSFTIIGFIGSYLFTRLRLEGAFSLTNYFARKVEPLTSLVEEKAEQVEQVKKDLDETSVAVARAQAVVENQLDVRKGGATVEELSETLRAAPRGARVNAFYLAREQRRANWRDGDRDLVERTVPVFEALIACDDERRYHRNHGELGYALKDQDVPNYQRALAEFDETISIRAPGQALRFWPYEFNRAWCKIELDSATKEGRASSDELAAAVCADLELAVGTRTGLNAVKDDPLITRWIGLNRASTRVVELERKFG